MPAPPARPITRIPPASAYASRFPSGGHTGHEPVLERCTGTPPAALAIQIPPGFS